MAITPCNFVPYKPCAVDSNFIESFLSRISHVYQDGPNMRGFLTAFLQQHKDVESILCTLLDTFDIDTATGNQLDIVGLFIGLPRTVCNVRRNLFFGFFNNDPDCQADFNVGLCNGPFYCGKDQQLFTDYTMVDDDEYRLYLKTITYSMAFDGTLAMYERIVQVLFDGIDYEDSNSVGTTRVAVHGFGKVSIVVDGDATREEKQLIELKKFVLPYYGSTVVKVIYGTDHFFIDKSENANGLCNNFAKAI